MAATPASIVIRLQISKSLPLKPSGVTSAVMFVPSLLITSDAAPEEIRTTAMGAFNAAGSLGFIVGPLTGGFVSQLVAERFDWETGYRAAFAVAGCSAILCVAITLPFLLRLVRSEACNAATIDTTFSPVRRIVPLVSRSGVSRAVWYA